MLDVLLSELKSVSACFVENEGLSIKQQMEIAHKLERILEEIRDELEGLPLAEYERAWQGVFSTFTACVDVAIWGESIPYLERVGWRKRLQQNDVYQHCVRELKEKVGECLSLLTPMVPKFAMVSN